MTENGIITLAEIFYLEFIEGPLTDGECTNEIRPPTVNHQMG